MRLTAAVITFACLSACSMAPSPSEQALVPGSYDEWRQNQATQDANAILQGMAQAREREDELARSAR
jgi:hypothetical protein